MPSFPATTNRFPANPSAYPSGSLLQFPSDPNSYPSPTNIFSGGDGTRLIPAVAGYFHDTGRFEAVTSGSNTFTLHDSTAKIVLDMPDAATTLDIEAAPWVTNTSGSSVVVYVNGVYSQTLTYGGTAGVPAVGTATGLGSGAKVVEIYEVAPITRLRGLFTARPRATSTPGWRLVALGDSILRGLSAIPLTFAFAQLLRVDKVNSWTNVGINGDSLFAHATTAGSFDSAVVDAYVTGTIVPRCDGTSRNTVLIEWGTNDYGVSGGQWSAADFGTAYAYLLDKIHAVLPSVNIICITPFTRTTETANANFSNTLGDYRTQISTAVSTRTSFCLLMDGPSMMTSAGLGGDGLHPTNTGHQTIHDNLKSALGWLRGTASATVTVPTAALTGGTIVNTTIDPTALPGATGHWNAEESFPGVADGTSEQNWPNLVPSQTAWNLTQATAANRPVVKTGVSPKGKRGIRADGVNDRYKNSGSPTALTAPYHIFLVFKVITGGLSRRIFDGATNRHGALFQSAVVPTGISIDAGTTRAGTSPDYTTNFIRAEVLIKANASHLWENDAITIADIDAGTATFDGLTLFDAGGAGGFFGAVELYEFNLYSQELTGDDLIKARARLSQV